MKCTTCTVRRMAAGLGGAFLCCLLTWYYGHLERPVRSLVPVRSIGPLVDNPGCHIPDLDPYDPLVASMLWSRTPLVCTGKRPPLVRVEDDLRSLSVVESSLKAYAVREAAKLRCCYRELWREAEVEEDLMVAGVRYSNSCAPFAPDGPTRPGAEFVRVECRYVARKVYVDFFAFAPRKSRAEERCRAKDAEFLERDWLSVLIIGIDSVSRINFHRQMPRTDQLLRDLGAIEMLGYNKVGDNTYPNLLAALTGLTVGEAEASCRTTRAHTYDACPFVWANYSRAGYRTAFGEDDAQIGTFNYNGRRGFSRAPTDYYLRPFHVEYNKVKASGAEDHDGKLCVGSKANVDVLLDYATAFATAMSPHRHFGLFWQSSVTHDALNDAQQLDERLARFLARLHTSGQLNRTLLVVTSDHGLRFGPIRQTFHGWLEERLPLLTFTFPPRFRDRYPRALAAMAGNVRSLTTPFDLHSTLLDLLDLRALGEGKVREGRGRSLFFPVDGERTCDDAGIPAHYCTCRRVERLRADDAAMKSAARFVVDELNEWLLAFPQCARLEVGSVKTAARRFVSGGKEGQDMVDFVLVFAAAPSGALFEATVRNVRGGWQFGDGQGFDVSRVNVYGTQSWCVDDAKAKLYCFCATAPKGL